MRYHLLLLLLVAIPCLGQTNSTGNAETKGTCSPAVSGSNNQFIINCSGVSKQQGQKMLDILNKILANQLDTKDVMAKLDEILNTVDPNKPVVTYDFNAVKRIRYPGGIKMDDSAVSLFNEFINKMRAQDWAGLAKLAEPQKTEHPEWLTPYFFSGMAYGNLCQKEKALSDIEYFLKKALSVYTYEQAETAAEGWLANWKADHWPPSCQ